MLFLDWNDAAQGARPGQEPFGGVSVMGLLEALCMLTVVIDSQMVLWSDGIDMDEGSSTETRSG